jgi:alkaline phosphatase D
MSDPRRFSRRALIARASALAAAAAPPVAAGATTAPRFLNYPFSLGVAAGEPTVDGFVIWTRLAPDPFDPEALPPEPVAVAWEVAADETFQTVVRAGQTLARPERAHAVHVELRGLAADRPYWYRFRAGGETSGIGRARTTVAAGSPLERFRFAFTSCQHYEQGFFSAYRHMVDDAPELIVHLGDYIYETSWGAPVRRHEGPEPTTLTEYRARHALYKLDPDLQAAHAACPWLVTWDDHEVDNDYAGPHSETFDDPEAFLRRRAAAYQAYFEHMPLRASATPREGEMRLYQRYLFGDLLTLHLLDIRQYRSDQACPADGIGGGRIVTRESCPELDDPTRTMLGEAQERWLLAGLGRARAHWNVIAQQTLFATLDQQPGDGAAVWSEGWSGYGPARERILAAVRDQAIGNLVVIGGDMHSFWVTDLKVDGRDSAAPALGSEFVCTSLAAAGPPETLFRPLLADNSHVRFYEGRRRGYAVCDVTRERWQTDFRVVDDIRRPDTRIETLASFAVESGRPGAQPLANRQTAPT